MVDGRHAEKALSGAAEDDDLDNHGDRLNNEDGADDDHEQLGTGGHGQASDETTEC